MLFREDGEKMVINKRDLFFEEENAAELERAAIERRRSREREDGALLASLMDS